MMPSAFRIATRTLVVGCAFALAGCSVLDSLPFFGRGSEKPTPAELPANPALMSVRPVWTARVGAVNFPLTVAVNGTTVSVASSDGTVAAIDGASGRDLWRTNVKAPIAAGVGSDGKLAAVVTGTNDVIAIAAGNELWRQKLSAVSYTPPFVGGARVFVLTADRAVTAFDGQSGRKLWTQQRPGEPLVLRQSGVMLAVGDTLVVGLAGRMVGLNPLNGSVRWEAPVATPRGINDVERLVDLVGSVSRVSDVVCSRAFQAAVGCVDAARGGVLWTKPANGAEGLAGDENLVFGTEADGKVMAWRRANGERAWVTERLRHRGLTAPLALGRSVVVGESTGLVHFLSREDGSLLNRVPTDGSAIVGAPVVVGNTLVVVTHNGGIYAFAPE
ncbi:MAG: Pyrrolo-quinoline quinone [Ramlibacter sp.]|jgi:outer membrane protein assembly factor BamB|nr:Pyrrolo-quinoline quinone [Ramlibacter sp.]